MSDPTEDKEAGARMLSPAARRALNEADRRHREATPLDLPPERGGRDGPEPIRFGDWERKGITSDF